MTCRLCPVQTPRALCYFHAGSATRSTRELRYCAECRAWIAWDLRCGHRRTPEEKRAYHRIYNREWKRLRKVAA